VIDSSLMGKEQHSEKLTKKKPLRSKAEKRADRIAKKNAKK